MNDNTLRYYLSNIRAFGAKHFRSREFIQMVNLEISTYRLTAWKMRGTGIARLCNRQANYLEKQLNATLAG